MGKIAEIINTDQKRTFDLIREPDALYLSVKCSDKEKHSKVLKNQIVGCSLSSLETYDF